MFSGAQTLLLETRVDSLRAALVQDPVIYKLGGFGEASFRFYYEDLAFSGTDAKVTFWPGDSSNNTYGPFDIGMNFVGNYNENPLSYRYVKSESWPSMSEMATNEVSINYFCLFIICS